MATVVKTVPLTAEQASELRIDFETCEHALDRIMDALYEASERRERRFWNDIARRCGYSSHAEAMGQKLSFIVDWAMREIRVESKAAD